MHQIKNLQKPFLQTAHMKGKDSTYDISSITRGVDATAQCWHIYKITQKDKFIELHKKGFEIIIEY